MTDKKGLFTQSEYHGCLKAAQQLGDHQAMLHAKAENGLCEVLMAGASLGLLQVLIRAAERLGEKTGQTFEEVLEAMAALYELLEENKEINDYDRS